MNLDKRKAVFNNQEISLMQMDGLKLMAERYMVKNIPLTYTVDTHDIPLNEYKQNQYVSSQVITQPTRVVKTAPVIVHTNSTLRQRLEQLKLQNHSLMHNIHANQNDLHNFGNSFGEVTIAHQNHILGLRNKGIYNDRDLNIVNDELGYFQFKNRQNFLQHSLHDRTIAHNIQNDMIDYQLHYLDNYHGAQGFNSNALLSLLESTKRNETIIINEKKVIKKLQQSNIIPQVQEVKQQYREQRQFDTRKQMLKNRYVDDEIPIRIDKISKSRDNKQSVISREYKHSDHVKVILAENDEIVEVPDTQRVDNTNISQLINESTSRRQSTLLL